MRQTWKSLHFFRSQNNKDDYYFDTPLAFKLEGKSRPHFFKGVTTIVHKLFLIVKPTHAVFGQKDAQQVLLIRQMNRDLNLGGSIVTIPTVRDVDGVAFSSRNKYLSSNERKAARTLYRSLENLQDLKGSTSEDLKNWVVIAINIYK